MRKHGRRDINHEPIIKWYRDLGCSVADTADLGLGLPDAFVGCAGVCDPVEIKSMEGELTPLQKTFIAAWRGAAVRIVRNQTDVVEHVQDMRRRARAMA
jgi:hypothetical protein